MPRGRLSADLTGRTFNRWTVISRTDERYSNGSWYWNVRCACGALGKVHTQGLTTGRSKSCGCYGREMSRKRLLKHGSAKPGSAGHAAYIRGIHEMQKYGLTPHAKQALLAKQHDACAICGYEFGQKLGDYHIDHCHTTGNVRGILCDLCNRGLGFFRDKPDFLREAARYLSSA